MELQAMDMVLVVYDKEKELLILYDLYSDGTKSLHTHIELSRLEAMGIDTACHALGKNILVSIPSISDRLFP